MRRSLLGLLICMLGIAAQVAQQQQAETTGLAFLETTKNPVAHNTDVLPVSSGKVEVTEKAVTAPSLNTGVEMLDIAPNTSKTEILPASQTSTANTEVSPASSSTTTTADTAAPSSVDAGVAQKLEIAPKSSASVEIAQVSEANVAKTELVKTVSTGDNSPSSAETTVGSAAKAAETTSTVDVKPASEIQDSANKNSQASSAAPVPQHGVSITDILGQESQWQHQLAYDRLQKQYAMSDSEAMKRPFDDILVSYPIAPSLALTSVRDKFLVAPHALQRQRRNAPVIYAAGIATHPDFELAMVDVGLQVHAFDCTLPADPIAKLTEQQKQYVHFHPWCLGSKLPAQSSLQTEYARKSQNKTFEFHSIQESQVLLGHSHIDVLKLDIEGYEWEVLEREILQKKVFSVGNAASVSLETTSTSLKLDEATSTTASTSGTAKVAAEFSDQTKVKYVDPASTVSASTTTAAESTSTSVPRSEQEPTTLVANSASGAGSSGGLVMLDVAQIKAMTTTTVNTPAQRRFLRALSTTASESLQSNEQPQINFVMSNDKPMASGTVETPSVLSTSESKLVAKENTVSAFKSPQYLPSQLLFELHTKGANPNCVEPRLTREKDRNAVNRLFAELWSLGYRVVFKYLNPEDPTCADFTLIRVPEAQLPPLQTPSNAMSGASDAVVVSSTESVPSVTSEATVGGTPVAPSSSADSVVTASSEPADVTKNQETTAVQFLNLDTAAVNTRSATTAAVLPTSFPQDERVARKTSELQFLAPATSVTPVPAAASTAATTPQVQFLEPQAANAASTASNAAILSATQVPSQSQVQFLEPTTTSAASSTAVAAPATAQVQFLETKSNGVAPSESTAAAAATPTSTLAASGTAAAVQFLEPKSTATTAAEPTTTAQVQFLNADAGSASAAVPTAVTTAPTVASTTAASAVQFLEPASTSSALPSTTTTTTTAMSEPAQQQVQFLEAKTVVTAASAPISSSATAATTVATPAQVQFLESASSGVDKQATSTATVQAPSQQQVQFLEPQTVATTATSLPAATTAVTTVASSKSPAQVEILDLQPTKANTVVSSVATPSATQESAQPQVQFLELQTKSDTTSVAAAATAPATTTTTTTTTTTASSTAAQAQSEQALQFLQAPAVSANAVAQVNTGASSTAAAEAKSSTELQFLKQRRLRYQA